jgi:PDZ domain-containing protein
VKRFSGAAVVLGLLGLVTAFLLWWIPANDFLFVPDEAKPLAGKVEVEGGKPGAEEDGVYYVDLFVRRIRTLEQLLPFTRPEGSTFVEEEVLSPNDETDEERRRQNREDMQRSEEVASAVALRALGYEVTATPRGALVTSVAPDVPAAGVLESNDVIVAVDGMPVRTPDRLRAEIGKVEPGAELELAIRRGDEMLDVTVRTVASPQDASRAVVGILVDQDAEIELPLDVDIDLGRVGGPSAGLPFALEIARQLGRDVTHGCRIAATGALALDGTVVPIGGVKQKTIGARRADVDFFLVPAGENAQEAQRYADGLRVIPVESFQQALRTLATDAVKC